MKARRKSQKNILIAAGVIIVAAVLIYLAAFAHHPSSGSASGNGQTVNPSPEQAQKEAQSAAQSSGSSQKTSSVGSSLQGNTTPGSGGGTGTSTGGIAPAAPTGDFVSAHTVSSSAQLNSVCNTSPGATCQISFSNGSVVKSLPAQVASNGSTNWNWVAGNLLSTGTWKVTATATMNGKSSTATDATNLTVQ